MNKCYSPATKNEFDSVRANNKKKYSYLLDLILTEILIYEILYHIFKIQKPGLLPVHIVIFLNQKKVLSSLMKELSKTFKKYRLCIKTSYKDNIHKTDEDTSIESVLESDILDLDPRLGNIKFNLSKDFVERVKIGDIEFSKIGQDSYEITVQVNGCSEKGFVDLIDYG